MKEQMTTSAVAIHDRPLGFKRKYQDFDVPSDVFRRFENGRAKFERWTKFFNLQDEKQYKIYEYAKKNRDATIILRDEATGALKAIRPKAANE